MRRDVQAVILILVGGAVLRISIGDTFLNYVKDVMKPWLIASGAVLVVLGVLALIDVLRKGRTDDEATPHDEPHEHDDGHGHAHGPRAAWLLLLPVLAIFLIAPPALGAYAAARDTTTAVQPRQASAPPLPAGDPVTITVSDYVGRAVWDEGRTLEGRNVQMIGFVTPNPEGGWWLTRLALACCAADALASKIQVLDTADLPANTWVSVTGTWVPGGGTKSDTAIPLLKVDEIAEVPQPKNPYE
ncbi:MAG: TIGR03943 family putative permease subunit [Actinomycetota bacterium]